MLKGNCIRDQSAESRQAFLRVKEIVIDFEMLECARFRAREQTLGELSSPAVLNGVLVDLKVL